MSGGRVVIAGAGIVGASIAYHLARRGAEVIVLDANHPASGASGKSFGWINATFSKRPRTYFDLSCAAIEEWHRLERELPGDISVQWGGSVAWSPNEQLLDDVTHHQAWAYDVRVLGQTEFSRLLLNIATPDLGVACWSVSEGAVDPVSAVRALLAGMDVRSACAVTGFDLACRRVDTGQGSIEAETLVLACGVDCPGIAALAEVPVPLQDSPGVLLHTAPLPPLIDRIFAGPDVHFRQCRDGRIVIGGQLVAGVGTAALPAMDAGQILARAVRYLPALQNASIERITLGRRVMPRDEYPIIGFASQCPGLYIAAMHSGVTLAPLIGRLAAAEILDGVPSDLLNLYRPARFL